VNTVARKSLVVAMVVAVASCVAPRPLTVIRYSHPTATQDQFMKDRYECLMQAQQGQSGAVVNQYGGVASSGVITSCGVWVSCLGARGYVRDPNGPLAPPPGMAVACR